MSESETVIQSNKCYPGSDDWRSAIIAFPATVLIHLGIIYVLPEGILRMNRPDPESMVRQEYEISLKPPDKIRFVEASLEPAENDPDRTEYYSFRNQQAADHSSGQIAENLPRVDGEEDSQKIVNGRLEATKMMHPGLEFSALAPGTNGSELLERLKTPEQSAQASVVPAASAPDRTRSDEVIENDSGSGFKRATGPTQKVPDRPWPDINENTVSSDTGTGDTSGPRVRPRLAPELVSGPLMRSNSSAGRRGNLAVDATFSEFGEYQQRFYAAIQTGWYREIQYFQPMDTATQVHVRLTLHSDGQVTGVKAVHTTAGAIATLLCENAVSQRSPFRRWTPEMVRVFGDKQVLNLVFHYR